MWFNYFMVVVCWDVLVVSVVSQNVHQRVAVGKFENGIEQQDFFTVLSSIEDRLRNLDTVYSMQLSQTLETKLDLYSRKLESLDTKINRLEALVMLNLDKISENISTKNFKDDISKTNTNRKIDTMYESINNRLSYMDRKYETSFNKAQEKLDLTYDRLSKIENALTTKGTNMETEISDTVFAIDDLKNNYNAFEEKIYNITGAALNISRDSFDLLRRYIIDNKKSMNRLHDNIVGNLQFMDNKTSHHMKLTQETNDMLKKMKTELKEDFNSYANKVADMNTDIWKYSDTTGVDLLSISTVLNNTKIDLQNGIRSLTVQIGKISNKSNLTDTDHLDKIDTKLTTNFEKILMNQDVFMDSCHRLQMDEAQIETEISVILEKFIDMIEKKIASETRDIRGIEKALKNHDSRVNRNIHQTNTNVISLFEKYTANSQIVNAEIKRVHDELNDLFSFVQDTKHDDNLDAKVISSNLQNITTSLKSVSSSQSDETRRILDFLSSIDDGVKNCLEKETLKVANATSIDRKILDIFGPPPNSTETTQKPKCEKFSIDVRAGGDDCNEGSSAKRKNKKKKKNYRQFIDVRNGVDEDNDNVETTTTITTTIEDPTVPSTTHSNDDSII